MATPLRSPSATHYRYDAFNRLIQVSDDTGSVRNVVYRNLSKAQRPIRQSAFQTRKDDFGRTVWIASASHGSTIRQYNAADQLIRQRNGNGDTQIYAYDLSGQRVRYTLVPKKGEDTTTTIWRYEQGRLVTVSDAVQTERIHYNERGQPASKTVSLKLANGAIATHVTRYSYTTDGSLASQSLPDGTRIEYERNGQGQGPQHTQAYAYDNQSQLIATQTASRPATLKTTTAAIDSRVWRYHYDRNGNRVLTQENVPVAEMGQTRQATYDPASNARLTPPDPARETVWNAQGQLIAIRQQTKELVRYRYNHHGLRVSKQTGTDTAHTLYNDERQRIADLDEAGRIIRQYIWLGDHLIATLDADQPKPLQAPAEGLLAELTQTVQTLWSSIAGNTDRLAFVHVNHLGAPVAATDSQGHTLWQADYAPYGAARIISATVRPEPAEGQGKRAAYTLALRLPGQWEDEESGLYYNDFRYYDPQAGRYLSPDPLGRLAEALGSPNAYAYVNNNPLSYIDPWGLILFAFDGTENTTDLAWNETHNSSLSNVVQFRDLYASDNARSQYITGVGVVHKDNVYGDINAPLLDAGVAWSGPERIERMIDYFDDEADLATDNAAAMDVDIIGFSRGAAQAHDFANRIIASTDPNGYYHYTRTENGETICMKQKVNFRFMGLWDTVLSDNWAPYSYQLGIPDDFAYVAQAVALNEFRGHTHPFGRALPPWDKYAWGSFPLESIMGGPVPSTQTRIERGFIGAHADIGGGFGENENQLAQVALVWMVNQATAAGVSMNDDPKLHTIFANPVIHDKSDAIRFGSPVSGTASSGDASWNDWNPGYSTGPSAGTGAEDREVRYRDGDGIITSTTTQRQMTGTGMTFADTENADPNESLITYDLTRSRPDNVTGTVDMQGYLNWLNANGYGLANMTVQ